MSIKTTVVHECDACERPIDTGAEEPWVDALVYGRIFHVECWRRIGGPEVARLLGLDDVRLVRGKDAIEIGRAYGAYPGGGPR